MHTQNASAHLVVTVYIQPSERGYNRTGLSKDSIHLIIIIKCIYTILH